MRIFVKYIYTQMKECNAGMIELKDGGSAWKINILKIKTEQID